MQTWLIDTGPLVAFFDRGDPRHADVKERLDTFRGRLCTTGAVICESMHFLPLVPDGPSKLAEFVLKSGMTIFESTRPEQIRRSAELMSKYGDIPMDFADSTLVLLAEEIAARDILTLDRRGFYAYRTSKSKAFRLIIE